MTARPSRDHLEAFRSLLARRAGLRFDDDKLPLLEASLIQRLRDTRSSSVSRYLDEVATTDREIHELGRALTVSETYFFRDLGQFRALETLLRDREERGHRHVRILSAGCASGEEAYSIAMTAHETVRNLSEWVISIHAIDLNPAVLEKARAGVYSRWSLRATTDPLKRTYFRERGTDYELRGDVRQMVQFDLDNLARPTGLLAREEAFDIVFCRNVLMYFAPDAARAVVRRIARALCPGGHLFLGHAENLRGWSHDFHLKTDHDTFFYERRATLTDGDVVGAHALVAVPVEMPRLDADTSWFEAIARSSTRIEELSRSAGNGTRERADDDDVAHAPNPASRGTELAPAMDLLKEERFHDALRMLATTAPPASPRADVLLLRAMLLVSTSDLAGAEASCEEILALDELHAGARYVLAICREHLGDRDGSIAQSRAAAYLDAEFAMPHLQLGRLFRRAGDLATARRELELALILLAREDASRIALFGGGFGRAALMELCRGELRASGETR